MKNKALVLLSGESTTIPRAEAEALFLALDPGSRFETPSARVVICETKADPFAVGRRIAFARRVGLMAEEADMLRILRGKRVRFRSFDLGSGRTPPEPRDYLEGVDANVDLQDPEYEVSLVRAEQDYVAVTSPGTMIQGWSTRRPRRRPFFHPAAIFPKLSRAMVNLSGCLTGETFMDPFAGTGSLPIEAHLIGARVIAVDQSDAMVRGGLTNMKHFGQEWLGEVRADATTLPIQAVDAVATDVPYGRASSTRGHKTRDILEKLIPNLAEVMGPKRRAVVMHPKDVPLPTDGRFALADEHELHVHKLLTRTISVLRRR